MTQDEVTAAMKAELAAIQKRAIAPWNVADIGEMRTRDVPRLLAALEAVVETIESLEDQPPFGATSEEQWQMDTEANVARSLREDIETALTESKGEPT